MDEPKSRRTGRKEDAKEPVKKKRSSQSSSAKSAAAKPKSASSKAKPRSKAGKEDFSPPAASEAPLSTIKLPDKFMAAPKPELKIPSNEISKEMVARKHQQNQKSYEEYDFTPPPKEPPRKFRRKRALDLMPAPMGMQRVRVFKMRSSSVNTLVNELERDAYTGVVKISFQEGHSRSAILLYRGRAVGCIYTAKTMPEPQPSLQSLKLALTDLRLPDTEVTMYQLPPDIVLPMSALFLGYPVARDDEYNGPEYFEYASIWIEHKELTACLAITLPRTGNTCIAFTHKGTYVGAFYIEDQRFSKDRNFVLGILRTDPRATLEASVLTPDTMNNLDQFGYRLSDNLQ
jgi:hypothetical protein